MLCLLNWDTYSITLFYATVTDDKDHNDGFSLLSTHADHDTNDHSTSIPNDSKVNMQYYQGFSGLEKKPYCQQSMTSMVVQSSLC